MSSSIFVTIAPNNDDRAIGGKWVDLKIAERAVGFLQEPLLKGFKATTKEGEGARYWRLQFFGNTEFKVDLFVSLTAEQPSARGTARAVWQEIKNGVPTEDQLNVASQWLRNAKSLKLDDYEERSSRWTCVDGSGVSMFSTGLERNTFERAVVLLALACAYRIRIEELMNTLSAWTNDYTELTRLARRASLFNALCYFRHPVQMRGTELPIIWDRMSERFRLDEFDTELTEQTNLLHQLVTDQQRDKEQRRWQRVGVMLGLISAVQVLSLFSEETRNGWWTAVLGLIGAGQ